MRTRALYIAILTALLATSAVAEPRVSAEINTSRVYAGDQVELTITIEDDDAFEAEFPTLDNIAGARIVASPQSVSQNSYTQVINGRAKTVSIFRLSKTYGITPLSGGRLDIPEQTVIAAGAALTTSPLSLRVLEPDPSPSDQLELSLDQNAIYAGETVGFRMTWRVADGDQVKRWNFNRSALPDGFEATLPAPRQRRGSDAVFTLFGEDTQARIAEDRSVSGGFFVTVEGQFFATEPGDYLFDQIIVTVDRETSPGRIERFVAQAPPASLTVNRLPDANTPPGFTGLLGSFSLLAEAAPTHVRVGDPIELTVTIRGREPMRGVADGPDLGAQPELTGRFKLAPNGWTYKPGSRAGHRSFTTTIRATDSAVTAIPSIRLPYFDTDTETYRIAQSEPIPIDVEAVRQVTAADALVNTNKPQSPDASLRRNGGEADRQELRATGRGVWAIETGPAVLSQHAFDLSERLSSPVAITVMTLPVIAFGASAWLAIARRRHDPAESRRRNALTHARRALDRAGPAAAAQTYIADTFDRPAEALTVADCERLLGERVRDSQALTQLIATAEAERFGDASSANAAPARAEMLDLLRRVDRDLRSLA
ncbi:MAG: hypothetical protein CMJ31_04710 [Phycisphaerae bacterium]|nr:hypothetical protein [Phycisphaerae bacterium]